MTWLIFSQKTFNFQQLLHSIKHSHHQTMHLCSCHSSSNREQKIHASSQVIYTIKSTNMAIFYFPSAFSCFLATYEEWGQFLQEVITGKDGDLLFIVIKEGCQESYKSIALGCLATEHTLTPIPLNQSFWRQLFWGYIPRSKQSHMELSTDLARKTSWSTPVHVTVTLRPGELVLSRKAMIKLILGTGLALHGTTVPRKRNKTMEMKLCVSIKDPPHTKLTWHWKITESRSSVIDKA